MLSPFPATVAPTGSRPTGSRVRPLTRRRPRRPARWTARSALVVTAVACGLLVTAAPGAARSKPPVKLDGKVNDRGVGKVKGGRSELRLGNFFFDNTFLKTQPGSVQLELENDGNVPHTFTVDSQKIDKVLEPGAKATVTLNVADSRPVVFYCRFHRASGMQGALFTKANTAPATSSGKGGGGSYGY